MIKEGIKFIDDIGNEFILTSIKKQGKESVLVFSCTKSQTREIGSKFQTTETNFLKTYKLIK